MTGGFAYVYDELGNFDMRCNLQSVDLESVAEGSADDIELKSLIEDFYISTDSKRAKEILVNWENELPKFVKVFPIEYRKVLGKARRRRRGEGEARLKKQCRPNS